MVRRLTKLAIGVAVLCTALLASRTAFAEEPQYVAVWTEPEWVNMPCPQGTADAGNGTTYAIACGKYVKGKAWNTQAFATLAELDSWLQFMAGSFYGDARGEHAHLIGVWHLGKPMTVELKAEEKSEPEKIEERKWTEYRAVIKAG